MRIAIPGRRTYYIEHLVLDLNGTIGLDGELLEGVAERLARLADSVHVTLITADTHGGAKNVGDGLGVETVVLQEGNQAEQKADFIKRLGPSACVAIGNGANDVLMLEECAIGVCVVGREGAAAAALLAANVVTTDICDALDLLLKPERLVATLRT